MKTGLFGMLVVLLMLASAAAHGLVGWPAFQRTLEAAGVEGGVIAALGVGWYFGSASMLAFAVIVLCQTIRIFKNQRVDPASLWAISVMYVVFGLAAFTLRHFNPHFLLFVITGFLIGLFAMLSRARNDTKKAA